MRKLANEEILLVYSTLPKFQTLAKFEMKKRCVRTVSNVRKISKGFGRGKGKFLMKKGCEEGGVSL